MKALEVHDRKDLEDWLFLFDANGELISSHRKIKLNATEIRMAVRVAARINPVDAAAIFHGRQLDTHQLRASFFEVSSKDNAGLVVRGTDRIWTDPTHKDVDMLTSATGPKGG